MMYVEVLKKRYNNVGRTFCDAILLERFLPKLSSFFLLCPAADRRRKAIMYLPMQDLLQSPCQWAPNLACQQRPCKFRRLGPVAGSGWV